MELNLEVCPLSYQNPSGKMLNACTHGFPPFIKAEPLGGSDLLVLEIFTKKFRFSSNYKQLPQSASKSVSINKFQYIFLKYFPYFNF